MKSVLQTEFGEKGNCTSACIASILELPISEVPNFTVDVNGELDNDDAAFSRVSVWLKKRELLYKWFYYKPWMQGLIEFKCGYHMIGGKSPRNTGLGHMVVGLDGKMVFDPHPDKAGLVGIAEDFHFLVRNEK